MFCSFIFCRKMDRYHRPCLKSPAPLLSHPLSSCSSRISNSRSNSRSTTAAAAGAIYSSNSTHLLSAISLAAASRVLTGINHPPKWALLSGLVCRVGREYKEEYNNHVQRSMYAIVPPIKNFKHIPDVWWASLGTVVDSCLESCASSERATGAGGCQFPSRLGRHRPREGGWGWGDWCLRENNTSRGDVGGDLDWIYIYEPLRTQDAHQSVFEFPPTRIGCSCPRNEDGVEGSFGVRACVCVFICMCV